MRAVLDTNVLISSLVFGGKPLKTLESAFLGRYDLVVSKAILEELANKLATKFGWSESAVERAIGLIRRNSTHASPSTVVTDCVDPDDNRILEAAVEGRADCIVSGDKHLLGMRSFRGIAILRVGEFLERLGG